MASPMQSKPYMTTHRALSLALVQVFLGCAAGSEPTTPLLQQSEMAELCGNSRSEATLPASTATIDGAGEARWFLVSSLNLGFADLRTGTRQSNAWRCYGFDLDGQSTSKSQSVAGSGSCARAAGSTTDSLLDGVSGIDNNFGRFTLPVLQAVDACLDNPLRVQGRYTYLFRIDGDPTRDASHVVGALYVGQPYVASPDPSRPASAGLFEPLAVFPKAYVSNGFWVSGDAAGVTIDLPLMVGFRFWPEEPTGDFCPKPNELRVPITKLALSIDIGSGAGMLGGAIPVTALRSSLGSWLARAGFCRASWLSRLATESITEPADVAIDPHQDPGRACDAISMGIGFTLHPITQPPTLAPIDSLDQDPCAGK
jgi:hypothetical protein